MTAKEDRSIRELYNDITKGRFDPRFIFPDTCFITSAIQQQFWELGGDRVITFPEIVTAELSSWIANPYRNSYLHSWLPRALEQCNTEPRVDGPFRIADVYGLVFNRLQPFKVAVMNREEMKPYGYDHYVNLLSVRKRLGIRVAQELQAELGREPDDNELRTRLQRDYDQRAVPIAFKGWQDRGKSNYMADEELVVSAVITAIVTGKHTLVLTRDTDVFDQFVKLFEIIVPDYYCHRFADVLRFNPDCPWKAHTMEDERFDITGGVVISRKDMEQLPPYDYTPVHCFCALVGNGCIDSKISISAYCLEQEMTRLLHTKTETGGKNTAHFPGENVANGMWPGKDGVGSLFVRCVEKTFDYEGVSVTFRDCEHTLSGGMSSIFVNRWVF